LTVNREQKRHKIQPFEHWHVVCYRARGAGVASIDRSIDRFHEEPNMRVALRELLVAVSGVALALTALAGPASATLNVFQTFPDAALSIDGGTFNNNDTSAVPQGIVNPLQSNTPAGATVVAAYLYVSDVNGSGAAGNVTLNGTFLPVASGTLLGPNESGANTRRFDVTANVSAAITAAGGGLVTHTYAESGFTDGAVLVVVWKNASTTGGTAIMLDGELAQAGDKTTVGFGAYTGGDFLMSIADSFSFNGPPSDTGQVSLIDVTTSSTGKRRLSSCAGGNDDGNFVAANGLLMTAGGVGDSPSNPNPTCTGGAQDDELYNLALGNSVDASPFIKIGDTSLTFDTNNPSFDDNIFGIFFSSTFSVVVGPPPPAPEPASLVLLGAGLVGMGVYFRRGRRR
jgi:PEP-CTERM motif